MKKEVETHEKPREYRGLYVPSVAEESLRIGGPEWMFRAKVHNEFVAKRSRNA